jgi:Carboxypeptidase regulatory-like domain
MGTHAAGHVFARLALLLSILFLMPDAARAQSVITGLVRDATGGVLPGVTVEVASPVLIERVRSAFTDEQGRYSIVDLRPGAYTVTFTLTGFSTVKREGVELPSNFTLTINADLRVGSLEESITVTGASPIVDVQSTQRTHVLNRELLDAVPSARNYSGLAALMPGVRSSNTDVGGNQQMEQIYMTVHGSRQTDTTLQVDGMLLNSLMNDGQVQAYFSDAAQAEMTFQTSGVGADVSGGGVRINMIPKDGGNRFGGSAFAGGTDGSWQSDNVTDELRARGLVSGDRVDLISDVNVSLGGPLKRGALWFFASWRRIATNEVVANNFYRDGRPGIEDQWIQNQLLRLTWQLTPRNKVSAYQDRYPKFKGHEMGAFTDPETGSRRREPEHALYYTAQAKWTSTVTSRLLLEAGYSSNIEYYTGHYQPGIRKPRNSPEWFTQAGRQDLILGDIWAASNAPETGDDPKRFVLSSSASYVTGSHRFKTGVQWSFGNRVIDRNANADLVQLYREGRPDSVRVYNTPVQSRARLDGDVGVYAQDSWTLDRLTLNMGVRFEKFVASIEEQAMPAGRFVPARQIAEIRDLPNWFDVTPRLGLAYDLFGDSRTALKATFNKYMAGQTTGFPERYNPLSLQNETRRWDDLNNDDVAQDHEIGPRIDQRFGEPVATIRPGPDLQREYDLEYSLGAQHEIARGTSVTAAWFRRGTANLLRTDNLLVSLGDYTPVDIVSPLTGEVITVYNLNGAKLGHVDRVDVNSTDASLRRRVYNGFEFGFTKRTARGSVFGGWTFDRIVNVACDSISDPNSFRFCDQSALPIPFRHEVKLAGTYMVPIVELQVNGAFQSYPGSDYAAPVLTNPTETDVRQVDPSLAVNWSLTRNTRYAADCIGPCRPGALVIPGLTPTSLLVPLIAPGSKYPPRQNQLDLGVRRIFRVRGGVQLSGQMDLFNILNVGTIKGEIQVWGPTLGRPTAILQPRTLRLAMQVRF